MCRDQVGDILRVVLLTQRDSPRAQPFVTIGILVGVMIESNIEAGNQPIPADLTQLKYGCSVTDACVDWETTRTMLLEAAQQLREVLPERQQAAATA